MKANQVISGRKATPTKSLSCSLDYNSAGRLQSMTYPSGLKVAYDFDDAGRIQQINLDTGALLNTTLISNVSYQPFGPISAIEFASDVTQSYSYDQDYRMKANQKKWDTHQISNLKPMAQRISTPTTKQGS